MSAFGFVMIGLAVFVVIVVISRTFNHLVLVKNNVQRAWSDISVLLRQRQDEIAKLIAVCGAHADFERGVLERVARARGLVGHALLHEDLGALGKAERGLRHDLGNLIAVAEAYPKLRAEQSFTYLSRRISELETSIADRREFYNATAEINNTTIQSFPELIFASSFGFRAARFLVVDTKAEG
jgi:LemA protein